MKTEVAPNLAISITVEKDGFYEVNGTKIEPSVSMHMLAGASKLRRQLRDTSELIVCPGVYDGLSARIAMELGFKALYMVCLTTSLPKQPILTLDRQELGLRPPVWGWQT